jgi:hypothetical protein
VGYYGGINYGYGYGGVGYEGGRWEGNRFLYNTSVNNVNAAVIHSTYSAPVTSGSENHVSSNGGNGGVEARPTPQQEAYAKEQHVGPVAAQTQQMQAARNNPALFASANQGKPPIASELPSHNFNPPSTGNAATNKTFQQQLNELSARQTQDHENLEQRQEEEHQQATQKNYSDKQIQQMEQRHAQQTQQLEQQHASQNKQMEQRQSSQSSSKQQSNSNSGKPH